MTTPDENQTPGILDETPIAEPGRRGRPAWRRRGVLGAVSLIAPLMLVGMVGAAPGGTPLDAPVEAVVSAAGIGGNSGDHRNDFDNRAEAAGDVGQPGSCPGKACEAPGHNTSTGTESGEEATAPDGATVAKVKVQQVEAHANGKGCDDKLFAEGSPPFGGHDTPVGPCNEGEQGGEQEETAASPAGEDVSGDAPEVTTSTGNGNGHAKDNGIGHSISEGQGHVKHGEGEATVGASGVTDLPGAGGIGNGKGKGNN